MFRLLCKLNSQTHKKGLSDSPIHQFCYFSSIKNQNLHPSIIEDIRNACKVPDNIFQRESEQKSSTVVKFLQDCGFTQTQAHKVVSKFPRILSSKIDKNLKPKINFLASIGLSESEVAEMVTTSPFLLKRSLKNHIVPSIDFLRTALGGDQIMLKALKRHPSIIYYRLSENMKHNILTLRNAGVAEDHILKLSIGLKLSNVVANTPPGRFREVVSAVAEIGFPSSSAIFIQAVSSMAYCGQANWAMKQTSIQSLGFSGDEFTRMIRKRPDLMCVPHDNIKAAVEFYVVKFHWTPSQISNYPVVLLFDLHKRIIPRCSVLLLLVERNILTKRKKWSSILMMTDNLFLERYVTEYMNKIPEVLDIYKGTLKSQDFDIDREKLSRVIKI